MNVAELIEILQKCDPNLPVAVHANGHTYSAANADTHGPMRVAVMGNGHLCIGNLDSRDAPNSSGGVVQEVDGGPYIPPSYTYWINGQEFKPDPNPPADWRPKIGTR